MPDTSHWYNTSCDWSSGLGVSCSQLYERSCDWQGDWQGSDQSSQIMAAVQTTFPQDNSDNWGLKKGFLGVAMNNYVYPGAGNT